MDASTAAAGKAGVNVAGPVTIGDAVLLGIANSTTSPDHASVKTAGSQTYNGAATLGYSTILADTAGGAITFKSTIDAAWYANPTLTVNTAGITTFMANVGAGLPLASLTTDSAGATVLGERRRASPSLPTAAGRATATPSSWPPMRC